LYKLWKEFLCKCSLLPYRRQFPTENKKKGRKKWILAQIDWNELERKGGEVEGG
jgi:hypothetical protein